MIESCSEEIESRNDNEQAGRKGEHFLEESAEISSQDCLRRNDRLLLCNYDTSEESKADIEFDFPSPGVP